MKEPPAFLVAGEAWPTSQLLSFKGSSTYRAALLDWLKG